ncbi:eCIS core domain-containing protein [Coleofasciculus sp.]|uniref:eCIS core domain-containing protein n=1 Tax=Coleofasciculus sp. TaxID=3100458 RepID=UPI003A2EAD65
MQEAQQQKSAFIPPTPAPKDSATGFTPPRFPVQAQAKQPSASGKVTRAYSSYEKDLIQAKLLQGMDEAIQKQAQAEAIQSKDAHGEAEDGVQLKDDGESVQQKSPQDIAADGFRGTPRQLPHLDQIQQSFGQDLSHVQAYMGKEAAAASQELGAAAYTSGNRIAFAKTPSVGLAAHEAAHVMQQQSGKVQLKDGLGQVGDKYEQHADAVADAVVARKSAEPLPLLEEYTEDTMIASLMPSVMAKAQRVSFPLSDKEELQAACLGGSCPPLPEPEIPELTNRHYYIKGRARGTEAAPGTIEWTNGLAASYALNVARGKPDAPIVGLPNDMNIWDFKKQWVRGYLEVIEQAATTFKLPSILVAGIAFREVGGDPPISDPLAYGWRYSTRISREYALRTSYGNLSIQIRRAMESLGYDSALTTGTQLQAIRESLLEPRQNIFIAAQHMSDLRNIDFPGKKAADLTRDDIMVIAARYHAGPELTREELHPYVRGYGQRILLDAEEYLSDLF